MLHAHPVFRPWLARLLLVSGCTLAALPIQAKGTAGQPAAVHKASRSQNVTINLINRLVERGALTAKDAAELIQMAEEDAAAARAEAAATQTAPAVSAAAVASSAATPAPIPDDVVRVTYVPEVVKAQLRDEIKREVMTEAREEKWASPGTFPDWVSRLKLFGDFRFRGEGSYYPAGSDNTGAFPNFNAINTGAPFDVTGSVFSPQNNVDQQRTRVRLRARLGVAADLGEGFTAGTRLATGENNSPVTQNQSLGAANSAQGGNFSKYAVWLDRGFLRYDTGGETDANLNVTLGRFDNPFFSTSMIWADDLGFDGAAVQSRYQVADGVTPFLAVGAFPVFNTDLNFASNQPAKFKSVDKWLAAVQTGANLKLGDDLGAKVGAAYYDFQNIEGKLSSPFTPVNSSDAGNTDITRPAFAQKGNTYMALRNIVPGVLNNFGTINQWQYFGLATPFRDLAFDGRLDFDHFAPFQLSLIGGFVKNLAFHRSAIAAKAVNNLGPAPAAGGTGTFAGGDTAWLVAFKVGKAALEQRWDWNASLGYRYVESDAVIDGFCDSDFGGGGTNLKGFTVSASLALSKRVWVSARWMSADSVAGPLLKNDILQLDANAKF